MRGLFFKHSLILLSMFCGIVSGCRVGNTSIRDPYADLIGPDQANSLSWVQTSLYAGSNVTANWAPSISNDFTAQRIQFYIGSNCDYPIGTKMELNASVTSQNFSNVDGSYTYKITSLDHVGNTSVSDCSSAITLDTLAPTLTIDTAATWINNSNKAAYSVSGSCSDAGSGISGNVTVILSQGGNQKTKSVACSSGSYTTTVAFDTTAVTAFTDGSSNTTITVSATDAVAYSRTITATRGRDVVASTISITSAPSYINIANQTSFGVAVTCSDVTSGISGSATVSITDSTNTVTGSGACGTTINLNTSSLNEGASNISITASVSDVAGNAATSTTLTKSKDTVAPVLALVSPSSNASIKGNSSVNILFNVTELNVQASPTATLACTGCTTASYTKNLSAGPLTTATTFTQAINTPNSSGTAIGLTIDYTDAAGNPATTLNANYTTDTNAPTVTLLTLNDSSTPATATNNYIKIALNANDASNEVTDFCLKYNSSTAPTSSDSCWSPLSLASTTPATSVSFDNYYFRVGFTKMTYTVYAWVRDEAGNISSLSNAGVGTVGTDKVSVYFDPGTPPQITALQVSNTDTPSSPVAASELVVTSGSSIYIKWNASDTEGLAANPISIYFTTDDSTYTLMAGGSNLLNTQNGGSCSVTAGFTGCAVLTSPSNSYYRVRVIAQDTLGTTVLYNSVPVNDTRVQFLAGNQETGLNGSAATAVFGSWGSGKASSFVYKHRLVVSDDGKVFYFDPINGLVWIDPANGVLKQFIKTGSSIIGNGSVIDSNTRIKTFRGIALDYSNNLLIYDHDQIRKVNLSTMVINQFIGGGTDEAPVAPVAPSIFKINPSNFGSYLYSAVSLIPLPNGDLVFMSNQLSPVDYRYEVSSNTIIPINYTGGVGLSNLSTYGWDTVTNGNRSFYGDTAMIFDPSNSSITNFLKAIQYRSVSDQVQLYTRMDYPNGGNASGYPGVGPYNLNGLDARSATTGMDGKIYTVRRGRGTIERIAFSSYAASPTITNVVGISISSYPNSPCADGTAANVCAVDIDTLFVNKAGKVYFLDQGTIRTLDDSNQLVTIFGQQPSFGSDNDATLAMNARFGNIMDIKPDLSAGANGRIVIMDAYSNFYRELNLNANVPKFPGSPSVCNNWTGPWRFGIDSSNGDLYRACNGGGNLYKNTRAGANTLVAGNGIAPASFYYDGAADGKAGANISFTSDNPYNRSVLGIFNNKIFLSKQTRLSNVEGNCMIKAYDISDVYRQSHFMGNSTCSTFSPTIGNSLASTAINQDGGSAGISNIDYSSQLGSYLFTASNQNKVFYSTFGGNIAELTGALPRYFYNLTHKDRGSNVIDLYYCGNTTARLYKYSVNSTTQVGTESALTWSMPGLACKTNTTLHYKEPTVSTPNGSIIFVTRQNGLDGIGEYVL